MRSMDEHRLLDEETRYRLLKRLEAQPGMSQRQLAAELGISVGKVNYCLKALSEKGHIKMVNFRNHHNKRAYLYKLTPAGLLEKAHITGLFLQRKLAEYQSLQDEIAELQREVQARATPPGPSEPPTAVG